MKRLFLALAALGTLTTALPAQHEKKPEPKETLHAKIDPSLRPYQPAGALAGEIRSIGADTMETLMKLWIEAFSKYYPEVRFHMEAEASGTAAPALTAGTADMGPVAREMLPNEIAPFEQKFGYRPLAIALAGGSYRTPGKTHAIAFFVNKENPIQKLTFAQLDAIFSTTRKRGVREDITRWGQLGLKGEWADAPITLYGVRRPNGIAHFVQERVLANGEYKDGIHEYTTVGSLPALDAITQAMGSDRFAIGYAGFRNVNPKVRTIALAETNGGPYVKGSFEEVVNRTYPLSRFVYIYLNRAPGKPLDPKVEEFLKFALSKEGQEAVVKEGIFLPLKAGAVKEQRAKLE